MSNDPGPGGAADPLPQTPRAAARRGFAFVLAAPSGGGKTSLMRALMAEDGDLSLSISMTTRSQRPGEQDGVHYYFVDQDRFERAIAEGEMLEYARVFDRLYGSPRGPVVEALAAGQDVAFDIDWQGHQQLRAALPGDVVSIFLLPPSMEELEARLRRRGQDSEAVIARRMAENAGEVAHAGEFDYCLINRDFDHCLAQIRTILAAERLRLSRQPAMRSFAGTLGQALGGWTPPAPGVD